MAIGLLEQPIPTPVSEGRPSTASSAMNPTLPQWPHQTHSALWPLHPTVALTL